METITGLVRSLISDDPKKYGSDNGTGRLFGKVLEIMEREEREAITTLTTVERSRRRFLEKNPCYDFRRKDKKQA